MTTYAVGDIQGCYQELVALLDSVNFDISADTLWVAGDLVNRGPDSLAVLNYLYERRDNVKIVLGNHDLHLLAVANGSRPIGKKDTFQDVLSAPNVSTLIDWLRQQPLLIHSKKYNVSMAHAGIPPIWSLDTAKALAREVETYLRSPNWGRFMANMYGNVPDTWNNNYTDTERLRVITNYFTRMRFCSADGKLDFEEKASRVASKPSLAPWYDYPNTHLPKHHKILFGHWAALEGISNSPAHIALDTGCVWGGSLTMIDIDSGQRFSYPAIS